MTMNINDTTMNYTKSKYRLFVVLKGGSETNSPQFWRTEGAYTDLSFEADNWNTWDVLPGFILFECDGDGLMINKDCIKSLSMIQTNES